MSWIHDVNIEENKESYDELIQVSSINSKIEQSQIRGTISKVTDGIDFAKVQELREKYEAIGLLKKTAIDAGKYFNSFTDPGDYVGRQLFLEQKQWKLLARKDLIEKEAKDLFRIGIPDSHKRQQILKLFKIDPSQCHFAYDAIKTEAKEDFLKFTGEIK